MIELWDLLLITISPSLIILLYFFWSDKFKEPKKLVLIVFIFGLLILWPASFLNYYSSLTLPKTELGQILAVSFLGPAIWEEILKFSVLYFFIAKKKEFNEPMDGIVYGVAVSLGFATYENIDYVFNAETINLSYQTAVGRAFSAVPMHGLNGCIMGFYFGQFAFKNDIKFLAYSLFMPFLFHGMYNFVLSTDYSLMYIPILIIMFVFAYKLHQNLKRFQLKKRSETEKKISTF